MRIISGTSRHPKDVPLVGEVLVKDLWFGRYKRTKKHISVIAAIDVFLSHDAKVNKPM